MTNKQAQPLGTPYPGMMPHPSVPNRTPWVSPSSPLLRTPLDALLWGLLIALATIVGLIAYIGLFVEFLKYLERLM